MKLYTEEQVRQIFENLSTANGYDYNMETYCDSLTPIELPSDEEIEKEGEWLDNPIERINWKVGAKWMKQQILKQNK